MEDWVDGSSFEKLDTLLMYTYCIHRSRPCIRPRSILTPCRRFVDLSERSTHYSRPSPKDPTEGSGIQLRVLGEEIQGQYLRDIKKRFQT